MSDREVALMAHLMRRAGFGAKRDELDGYAAQGYEATVEELLGSDGLPAIGDDLIRRYHPEQSALMAEYSPGTYWLYRMVNTDAPLQEKMALFWHGIFATGYAKITQGKVLMDQIRMFRRHGMGSFKTLLIELSRDPAMIVWLDNHENHKGAINENYGRELLELFSLGVGNYSEQDIKECARSFTGWTVANTDYMAARAHRDSIWPYGRIAWHFEYRPEDHDDGEKVFLGQRGRFNGEDIIDIICRQPATARFISRHMYSFFVADEPPVPQWPYEPPRDPEAIDLLSNTYFESGYDIRSMLRVLLNSEFFRSETSRYAKVKSPTELVAGVLRLTSDFRKDRPEILATPTDNRPEILQRSMQMIWMGQWLINPPSVEGWHTGTDWIDTGTLVERVNFASQELGNVDRPGVRAMVENITADGRDVISPEGLVDACLDQMGAISVSQETRRALLKFASAGGDLHLAPDMDEEARQRVVGMFQVAAASPEFQWN